MTVNDFFIIATLLHALFVVHAQCSALCRADLVYLPPRDALLGDAFTVLRLQPVLAGAPAVLDELVEPALGNAFISVQVEEADTLLINEYIIILAYALPL